MQNIFIGSNTPKGFSGFYQEQLAPLNRVYILKGGPGTGKSTLMKKLVKRAEEESIEVEAWHCSGDPNSLDGVHFIDKKIAVVDGTAPHALEANLPALKDQLIALGDHIDESILKPNIDTINELLKCKKRHFNSAYCQINSAFCNLSALYEPYKCALQRDKITQLATSLAYHIRRVVPTRKQFSTALTPDGFVTYKDNLEDKQIIALKASSMTIVKQFLNTLQNMLCGYSSYHCSFEPSLAESLIVGRYAVVPFSDCIQANDVIELDTALKSNVDEDEFLEEKKLYERAVGLAIRHMSEARDCHMEVEKFYVAAMDFEGIDKKTKRIEDEIFN
ncbi:MAG: hypothetical protein PHE93_05090 [Clostridia bacterium]|nr:hypothetical protein [Clostridia bacterium]